MWKQRIMHAGRVGAGLANRYLSAENAEEVMDSDVTRLAKDIGNTARDYVSEKVGKDFSPLVSHAYNYIAPKVQSGLSKAWSWFKGKLGFGGGSPKHHHGTSIPEPVNLKNMTGTGVSKTEMAEGLNSESVSPVTPLSGGTMVPRERAMETSEAV